MTNPKKLSDARMEKEILKECEAWACWNDLSEMEQEDVYSGYMKIFKAGYLKALELHEAETKMLVEALESSVSNLERIQKEIDICKENYEMKMAPSIGRIHLFEIKKLIEAYRSRGTKET